MRNIYRNAYAIIFLLIVLIIAVSLVSFIHNITKTIIDLKNDEETIELLSEIFPEICYYSEGEARVYTIYNANKEETGYAFYAEGTGYCSKIEIMIGLEDKNTIKGITIIAHQEKLVFILEPHYDLDFTPIVNQLSDLNISDCYLITKGDESRGKINGITGATISSKALVDIVRENVIEKLQFIK